MHLWLLLDVIIIFVVVGIQMREMVESKEHARKTYPTIRRVWRDLYLKIM